MLTNRIPKVGLRDRRRRLQQLVEPRGQVVLVRFEQLQADVLAVGPSGDRVVLGLRGVWARAGRSTESAIASARHARTRLGATLLV